VTVTIPLWLMRIGVWMTLLYRRLRYGYAFRRIPLTRGLFAIVDPEDYEDLAQYKWRAVRSSRTHYALRRVRHKGGKPGYESMHRRLCPVADGFQVDHVNRTGLDNRKANLRPATPTQNGCNRAKSTKGTYSSRFKGVTWNRNEQCWRATIRAHCRAILLGTFDDEVAAARAYDRAALRYHGAFAVLNFPGEAERVRRRLGRVALVLHFALAIWRRLGTWPAVRLTVKPAAHTVAAMPKKLYIIDGHAHIYAAYYAPMRQQLTSPAGEPTKATYIFTMAVLGLIEKHQPDLLVVAMDSKERTFRHEMYAEYKAHRPPMPEDLPVQIDRIGQILEAMRIPILRVPGFEADDIIGTLARRAAADEMDVLICSKDKDLLQLLDEHVRAFDIKSGTAIDPAAMREKMGIGPEQIVDCLALAGDAADNVPGVPLIGPKTARELIRTYGDLDKLYEHADEVKGKRGENLRNSKEQAYLSRKLVTLDCGVPIEINYDKLALHTPDREKLGALFGDLGFERLVGQLGLGTGKAEGAAPSGATSTIDPTEPASAKTVTHEYTLVDTPEAFAAFLAELKEQGRFAVDTETTSINAMRADLVGLSFAWQSGRAFYLPVRGPLGATHLDLKLVRRELGPILADEKIEKIGQNIKYDLHVLRNAGLPVRGVYFDTMVASYCLDPARSSHSMDNMARDYLNYECVPIVNLIGKGKNQLTFDMVDTEVAAEYAAEDADITWRLCEYLQTRLEGKPEIAKLFAEVEMPLVSVLAQMEHNGVSLNTGLLKQMAGDLSDALEFLDERIYREAETVFNIDSPKQLAEVLFDKLGLKSGRVGKAGRSTDASVLEQLSSQHPIAELVLEHRTLSKLKNTYADKLGAMVNPRTGRLHASFNQTVTATGRLSSSDPNLQNIPIRTDLGRKIRGAFVPEKATDCILSLDYSQVELRLLAHFSKDETLRAAFEADQDIHRFVGSQIFGVPLEEVTSEMRSRCKAVNFGVIYGQGAFGLSRSVGISPAEAKQFIEDYFARYSSIRAFIEQCVERARTNGYAETILGRRRRIADLDSRNGGRRALAERLAVNTVIQGSAADLIKVAMLNVQRRIDAEKLPLLMLLQVHDELVFEAPTVEADQHAEWIGEAMTTAIAFDVPLKVDVACGPSWLAEK